MVLVSMSVFKERMFWIRKVIYYAIVSRVVEFDLPLKEFNRLNNVSKLESRTDVTCSELVICIPKFEYQIA